MKNIIKNALTILTLLVALLSTKNVSAQKKIESGNLIITYMVDSFRVDKPSISNNVQMAFNDNLLKINGDYGFAATWSVLEDEDSEYEFATIYQLDQAKTLILADLGERKMAFKCTENEYMELLRETSRVKLKMNRLELLHAMLTDFKVTGQKEKINGYNCEKYKVAMPNGEEFAIWTTDEIALPFNFLKYGIGSLGELLKDKKFKGTLIRAQYGKNFDAFVEIDSKKIEPINTNIPEGYVTLDLSEVMRKGN